MQYALIGRRLGHSWSRQYFEQLFSRLALHEYRYELHETASLDGLRQWVDRDGIAGFNVTIPYKQAVIPYLDCLDDTAAAIGAVNCVTVEEGRLVGHNTDAPAFLLSLQPLLSEPLKGCTAIVLGTGGAAKAVSHALRLAGIQTRLVSRTPSGGQLSYPEAQALLHRQPVALLVNATPVGMYPETGCSPWPEAAMPGPGSLVYDLVYNPSPTRFLQQAAAAGAHTKDGSEMLHRQADLSWQLWQKNS